MSKAELRVIYRTDEEWTGQLIASARTGTFCGQGSAWFDRIHTKQTFVARLRSFPLTLTDPPMIEGGFWSKENRGSLEQCHLRIIIKPYNSRGTLLVHVDLASEVWKTPDADIQNSVTIRFLTEYAAVDTFADHLEQLLDGKREEAILKDSAA
jgi:hypothetical protein